MKTRNRIIALAGALVAAVALIGLQLTGLKSPRSSWQPPATDEFVKAEPVKEYTDAEVGILTTNANGTPAGAWAASLVRVPTEDNLYRDPATHRLYRVENGVIVENTNLYAGMPPEVVKSISQARLEYAKQEHPAIIFVEPPARDYMTDFYQQQYQRRALDQNQQALDEIRQLRWDYEWNNLPKK